ncbi:MAG: hypothetical protein IPL46_28500 [Saprospiraceae bacterium]|nr:hypothetical protein [Saprospiraceae bacterium]
MKRLITFTFVLFLVHTGCQKDSVNLEIPADSYSSKIPLIWNQLYLEVERFTPGYKPPVSGRNMAYINLSAYEAMVGGSAYRYRSLTSHYDDLVISPADNDALYNWEVCVHAAYERAFELFFPVAPAEQQFRMLEVSGALRAKLETSTDPDVFQRSLVYGYSVAEAVFQWSSKDQWGHEGYLKNTDHRYFPPTGDGLWKPTYPDFAPALLPHWGKVRTFAAGGDEVVPPPPPFDISPTSQLYQEADFTRALVNEVKTGTKEEDYWIAEFWSDDCPILTFSPAGRWLSITNQVLSGQNLNLSDGIALYTKVSMALADAGIKCWQEKYKYNCVRPIDYIRLYFDEPNWNTVMCPDGSGGYYTPSFPTYPSGHATFSVLLRSFWKIHLVPSFVLQIAVMRAGKNSEATHGLFIHLKRWLRKTPIAEFLWGFISWSIQKPVWIWVVA